MGDSGQIFRAISSHFEANGNSNCASDAISDDSMFEGWTYQLP